MVYPQTTAPFLLTGRKILIVDDDRLNIRILGGILKSEGYTLAEADSGERALELYATFRPDLVLLDVMMPGIDGFDTCRQGLGDVIPLVAHVKTEFGRAQAELARIIAK